MPPAPPPPTGRLEEEKVLVRTLLIVLATMMVTVTVSIGKKDVVDGDSGNKSMEIGSAFEGDGIESVGDDGGDVKGA